MSDQIVSCVCCTLLVLFNACFNRVLHNAVAFLTIQEEYKRKIKKVVKTQQKYNYMKEIHKDLI